MTDRPQLHALADRAGILPSYCDITGRQHFTSDESKVLILGTLGFDGSTEESAGRCLGRLGVLERERILRPVRVVRRSNSAAAEVSLSRPENMAGAVEWRLSVIDEQGTSHTCDGVVDSDLRGAFTLRLPALPGIGYHDVTLVIRGSSTERTARQRLILVPDQCWMADASPDGRRVFGICANLYSLQSQHNWGIGDFTDLSALCAWGGQKGAAFVGLNPLHALRNRGGEVSPYSPLSRLFRNVLYIDIHAVPECRGSPSARQHVESPAVQGIIHQLRDATAVAYEQIYALKLSVLRTAFDHFQSAHAGGATERGRAFIEFCRQQGEALARFASHCALEEYFTGRFGLPRNWMSWPAEYRRPHSPAVQEFCLAHRAEVEFHKYLQFELDRQLRAAADTARASAMSIGLYQDLATGSSANGSDAWAYPDLFVPAARLGAPPDDYCKAGQDWGLPPIHPMRLADAAYRYWTNVVRMNMAHAGALRIDHVMGLSRQYWIPPGASPLEGAYVRYPADELFGILALESVRQKALVIGEDLGTVPEGFSRLLESWGVLSCQVMYFQRDENGEFLPGTAYSPRALVTSTTHDHVPLAGFLSSTDLELRRRVGSLTDQELLEEKDRRARDVQALLRRLELHGFPSSRWTPADVAELCRAVHHFLCSTPARLVGLMLDDLAGEREPVNLPGLGPERHPSWSRRMPVSLGELFASPLVELALSGASDRAERR